MDCPLQTTSTADGPPLQFEVYFTVSNITTIVYSKDSSLCLRKSKANLGIADFLHIGLINTY